MHNRLVGAPRMQPQEKDAMREKKLKLKDKWEIQYQGNYERIYPLSDRPENQQLQKTYDILIEGSLAVWGESAAGGGVSAKQKIDELLKNRNEQKPTTPLPTKQKKFTTEIKPKTSSSLKKEIGKKNQNEQSPINPSNLASIMDDKITLFRERKLPQFDQRQIVPIQSISPQKDDRYTTGTISKQNSLILDNRTQSTFLPQARSQHQSIVYDQNQKRLRNTTQESFQEMVQQPKQLKNQYPPWMTEKQSFHMKHKTEMLMHSSRDPMSDSAASMNYQDQKMFCYQNSSNNKQNKKPEAFIQVPRTIAPLIKQATTSPRGNNIEQSWNLNVFQPESRYWRQQGRQLGSHLMLQGLKIKNEK